MANPKRTAGGSGNGGPTLPGLSLSGITSSGGKLPGIKLGAQAPVAGTSFVMPKPHIVKSAPAPKKEQGQDFLGWLGDILSRPLYGVTNVLHDTVNNAVRQAEDIKAGANPLEAGIKEMGTNPLGPAGSFLSGLFSTNPDTHRSTSQLIEGTTDAIGKATDPDYKNTKDNVNPWVKGIAGFAGDIALDPLTYVPGAAFLTVGSKTAKGLSTLQKAIKGTDDIEKSVAKATEKTVVPDAPTEHSAKGVAQTKVENQAAIENPEAAEANDVLTKILAADPRQAAQQQIAEAIKTPKASKVSEILKGLTSDEVSSMARAVTDVSEHEPLDLANWTKELDTKFGSMKQKELDALKLPKVTYPTGEKKSLADAVFDATDGSTPELRRASAAALREHHARWYRANFQQAKSQGKLVDALLQPVKAEAPVASGATETVTRAIDNYQRAHALDEARMQDYLGDKLAANLKSYKSADNFDKTMSRLNGILDGTVDVTTLRKLGSADRALLKHLGLEPDTIPVGFKPMKAAKNTTAPAHAITDEDAAAAGLSTDPTVRDYQGIAENALKDTLHDQYVEPGKPFRSRKGALKSEQDFGSGAALWQRQVTSQTWFTLMRSIDSQVSKRVAKLAGSARAMESRRLFLNSLRLAERKMDDLGMPLTMGLNEDRYHMLPSQVIEHLDLVDPQLMQRVYWNKGSALPHTALMDAVTAAIKGRIPLKDGELVSGPEAIDSALRQTHVKYTNANGTRDVMGNNLVGINSKGERMKDALYYPKNGKREVLSRPQLLKQVSALIRQEAPTLRNMAEENAKAVYARTQSEVVDLSDKAISQLRAVYENAKGPGDIIRGIEDISPSIKREASTTAATEEAEKLADTVVHEHVPDIQQEHAKSYSTQTNSVEKAVDKSKAAPRQAVEEAVRTNYPKARNRFHQIYLNWAKDQEFVAGGATIDLGKEFKEVFNDGLWTKLHTVFDTSFGQKAFRETVRTQESLLSTARKKYQIALHNIEKIPGASPEVIRNAFKSIRTGVEDSDQLTASVATQLRPLVEQVLGRHENSMLDMPFFREDVSLEQANKLLQFYGADKWQFDLTSDDAFRGGIESVLRQWEKHDPEDAIDYLNRMHLALSHALSNQTLADQFMEKATQIGALSKTPKPGYVRFADDSGKSQFAAYLPSDVYMHPAAAKQLQVVDAFSRNMLERKGPVWDYVKNYYQPMLDMWKYGMTLPNPTHHFRNLFSDASLTFLAEGGKGGLTNYRKATQALATHNGYDGFDFNKVLAGTNEVGGTGKVLTKSRQFGDITADDYYQAAMDRGNMPTYQQLEQLGFEGNEGKGGLATGWQKFSQLKGVRKLGGISEARDHWVRMAHFIQFVEKNKNSTKYKSLNDLFDAASEQVRKWHPDGSDLTNAERTFKLVIPFYSWTRHAIPLIAEAVLTKPGRVTAFNKASFNLAVAMGVNPNSLSDPWPDGTFPNYLTDQVQGPVANIDGNLFEVSPGIAPWDVLNQTVSGNALQNVLGQVTPALRVPFELATGTQAGTGAPITDWSDYADSQLPGVGQLARITGVSPTGTAKALLTGNGQPIQQQKQIAAGNKMPGLGFLNWLTGAGIQQVNQPNQIKYAQLEQRDNGGK